MDRKIYEREMIRVKTMMDVGDDQNYCMGYQRGLRRKFHGENFGTDDEYNLWLSAADSSDPSRKHRGQGYHDGYNLK